MTSLKYRAATSSLYNVFAQSIAMLIGLGRAIVLARLLEPQVFGIYAYAMSFIAITVAIPDSILTGPFLHRAPESSGAIGTNTHFTLNLFLTTLWAVVLSCFVIIFTNQKQCWLFLTLILSFFLQQMTNTHRIILTKQVLFKRIAIIQVITISSTTCIAIMLAKYGYGIWSLISINIVSAIVSFIMYIIIKPVGRVGLSLNLKTIRYFFSFGSKTFLAGVLGAVLERIDKLWTGYFLGTTALGFYSKAYEFATYPRTAVATPLNTVAAATYAELKGDRKALSDAFIAFNSLLIRVSFAISGLLLLSAPSLIYLILGEKWLPMLSAFRLLLIFIIFDPIKITIASVLVAVGKPEYVGIARGFQLAILLIGLILFVPKWDISGVAIAIDIMLFLGICLMLYFASIYVDYSIRQLFVLPSLGFIFGIILGTSIPYFFHISTFSIQVIIIKTISFLIGYLVILIWFERYLMLNFFQSCINLLKRSEMT